MKIKRPPGRGDTKSSQITSGHADAVVKILATVGIASSVSDDSVLLPPLTDMTAKERALLILGHAFKYIAGAPEEEIAQDFADAQQFHEAHLRGAYWDSVVLGDDGALGDMMVQWVVRASEDQTTSIESEGCPGASNPV